jgi:hypothetical protein
MIGKQKEKWMELCELAANEQDANKMIALITEINRLLEVKQQRLDTSNPVNGDYGFGDRSRSERIAGSSMGRTFSRPPRPKSCARIQGYRQSRG